MSYCPIPPPSGPRRQEIQLATVAHLAGALGILGAVVGGVVVPWIIWFAHRKGDSVFVEHHAREALNFQITVIALLAVCVVSAGLSCGLSLPKIVIPPILQLVFGLIATVKAASGQMYHYPLCIRMIRRVGDPATMR